MNGTLLIEVGFNYLWNPIRVTSKLRMAGIGPLEMNNRMRLLSILNFKDNLSIYKYLSFLYGYIPLRLHSTRALPPLRVGFILTYRCNLKCQMCKVWSYQSPYPELTTSEIKNVIRQIPLRSIITFTGGEPFIRDDIYELIEAATRRHHLHIITNGSLVHEKNVPFLIRAGCRSVYSSGLMCVGVSLEGISADHNTLVQTTGAFERTAGLIDSFMEHRRHQNKSYPLIDLKVVIMKNNVEALPSIYQFAQDHHVDTVSYQMEYNQIYGFAIPDETRSAHTRPTPPVDPIDPETLKKVIMELKRMESGSATALRFNPRLPVDDLLLAYQNKFPLKTYSCTTPWTEFHIAPYGDVMPCFSYSMGNVRTDRLLRIWNNENYRKFRKEFIQSKIWPGCIGCCDIRYCGKKETL